MIRIDAHSMTIREAYMQASSFLKEKPGNEQDAAQVTMMLLEHVLDIDKTSLLLHWDDPFPEEALPSWNESIARKGEGEPIQYIIGEASFYGLPFTVTPDVLIPRPETELLVEAVLHHADQLWTTGAPIVIDVGTGSGALAIALASQRATWHVHASDISEGALKVAQKNAIRHDVHDQIDFHQGDLLAPFIERAMKFDVLVSNPPYIPASDWSSLQTEVRQFEPINALIGGDDGLEPYRRMLDMLQHCVQWPRMIAFEHGQGQAEHIEAILQQHDYRCERIRDLAGIDRHILAMR